MLVSVIGAKTLEHRQESAIYLHQDEVAQCVIGSDP